MGERPVPEALIPHRRGARLVEAIVATGADTIVCRGRVPLSSALSVDGRVPAFAALELAAQAAAVQEALAAGGGAPLAAGYLVAVRDAAFPVDEVPADAPLLATVRRTGGAGALSIHEVRVAGPDGVECLRAVLSTHAGR